MIAVTARRSVQAAPVVELADERDAGGRGQQGPLPSCAVVAVECAARASAAAPATCGVAIEVPFIDW